MDCFENVRSPDLEIAHNDRYHDNSILESLITSYLKTRFTSKVKYTSLNYIELQALYNLIETL